MDPEMSLPRTRYGVQDDTVAGKNVLGSRASRPPLAESLILLRRIV